MIMPRNSIMFPYQDFPVRPSVRRTAVEPVRSADGRSEAETVVEELDEHVQEREDEKLADLESLADALSAFRRPGRDLDQWERVHLARGIAAVLSGCYGAGASEAALALTPEEQRSPSAKLPTDPSYQRFDLALFERVLNEAWAEPARRFPYFGRVDAT
jgi:hypothetical protein